MRPLILAALLLAACAPLRSSGVMSRAVQLESAQGTPTVSAFLMAQAQQAAQETQAAQSIEATQRYISDAMSAGAATSQARVLSAIETQAALSVTQAANVILAQAQAYSLTQTAAPVVQALDVANAKATALYMEESRAHTLAMNEQAEQSGRVWFWVFVISFVVAVLSSLAIFLYAFYQWSTAVRLAEAQKIMDIGQGELELKRAHAYEITARANRAMGMAQLTAGESSTLDNPLARQLFDVVKKSIELSPDKGQAVRFASASEFGNNRLRDWAIKHLVSEHKLVSINGRGVFVKSGNMITLLKEIESGVVAPPSQEPDKE